MPSKTSSESDHSTNIREGRNKMPKKQHGKQANQMCPALMSGVSRTSSRASMLGQASSVDKCQESS